MMILLYFSLKVADVSLSESGHLLPSWLTAHIVYVPRVDHEFTRRDYKPIAWIQIDALAGVILTTPEASRVDNVSLSSDWNDSSAQ